MNGAGAETSRVPLHIIYHPDNLMNRSVGLLFRTQRVDFSDALASGV